MIDELCKQLADEIQLPDEIKVVRTECVGGEIMPVDDPDAALQEMLFRKGTMMTKEQYEEERRRLQMVIASAEQRGNVRTAANRRRRLRQLDSEWERQQKGGKHV